MTVFLKDTLQAILQKNFDFEDARVPLGICESCRIALGKYAKGEKAYLSQLFDFTSISLLTLTRTTTTCECLQNCKGEEQPHSHSLAENSPQENSSKERIVEKRCATCFSVVHRGVPHQCAKATLCKNLIKMARNDQIASKRIASDVIANASSSPQGIIVNMAKNFQ